MNEISYCGYECKKCPVYKYTIEKNLDKLKEMLKAGDDATIESIGCLGCKSDSIVSHMCDSCSIKNCCLDKRINNCGECESFPCEYVSKYLSKETLANLKRIHDKTFL